MQWSPFYGSLNVYTSFDSPGILQSKIGYELRKLWLSKVKICEKLKPDALLFLQNHSIPKVHNKEIISLTGFMLSFSDWECFNLKLNILQSKTGRRLTELSSLQT